MEEDELERTLNVEGYEPSYNTVNSMKCKHSNRKIKNNSVFCKKIDQWVSVNYCANACRNFEASI